MKLSQVVDLLVPLRITVLDYAQELIKRGMDIFITRQILQFTNAKEIPIHFTGSIAHYLKEELVECLNNHGLKAGNIIRRPIDGLLKYHIGLLA